jgi:lysozyme
MKPSKWVFDTIKESEGLRLKAYICPAGRNTIGYGSAGADIHPGMVITKEEADTLLARDVETVTNQLNALLIHPVTQGQFDALCDFVLQSGYRRTQKLYALKQKNSPCPTP